MKLRCCKMGIHIEFDGDLNAVKKRMVSASYHLGNQVMSDMDQFVPYKKGDLANSAHLARLGNGTMRISYTQPYARRQFYGVGIKNYTRSIHPLATKRWDLKAKSLYMLDWVHAFTKGSGL